jgi:hypothetical protein
MALSIRDSGECGVLSIERGAKGSAEPKKETMKYFAPLFAVALLSAVAFVNSASADMKGAERLVTQNTPAKAPETTTPAGSKMSCPTRTVMSTDLSARGAVKPVSIHTAHACGSCSTKEVSSGTGKLASHKMGHTCAQAAVCCTGK